MTSILYLVSTLKKTGPTNVLYNIIKNLNPKQYNVNIITLSPEISEKSMWKDFENIGVKIYSLNLSRIQGYLFGGLLLKKLVKKINPEIINAQCFRTIFFTSLFLSKFNTIAIIHCDYDTDYTMTYGKIQGFIMSTIQNILLKKIKIRVCVSEFLCKMLEQKKKIKFYYINNGIDTQIFKPIENKIKIRQKLNLPINKKIWIWVGVITERKNPLLLASILDKFTENDFIIFCGNGNLYKSLRNKTKGYKNILLTGNVNNINEYLQAADYYISTSLSEGLPMSVLEAMSCGLPCVLSDIKQHKYVLKDKSAGLLFKTNDKKDLAQGIKDVSNIDYNSASINSRDIVLNNFSSELMAEKYMQLYKSLSRE